MPLKNSLLANPPAGVAVLVANKLKAGNTAAAAVAIETVY